MKNNNKLFGLIGVIALLFSVISISEASTGFVSGSFWSLNGDTIVMNDSLWNVNIGENASNDFKLNVKGDVCFNDSLLTLKGDDDNIFLSLNNPSDVQNVIFKLRYFFDGVQLKLYPSILKFELLLDGLLTVNNLSVFYGNVQFENPVYVNDNIYYDDSKTIYSKNGDNINISTNEINLLGNVTSNESITADSFIGNGIVPIGTIIAWCNHAGSIKLPIPSGYWVCNGSIITSTGVFNGQPSPNMTNRFLRGANYSKNFSKLNTGNNGGNNTMKNLLSHTHNLNGIIGVIKTVVLNTRTYGAITGSLGVGTSLTTTTLTATDSYGSNIVDSQPLYYDVVYLIRIE